MDKNLEELREYLRDIQICIDSDNEAGVVYFKHRGIELVSEMISQCDSIKAVRVYNSYLKRILVLCEKSPFFKPMG